MRIPACLGALVRSPAPAYYTGTYTGRVNGHSRPSTYSLVHVPPPYGTTSHDLTRRLANVRPRGERGFLRADFVTRALRLARSSRVSNAQNGTHWTFPLLRTEAVARTRWRNITARARVGAEKWLSNGAYALSAVFTVLSGFT